MAILGWTPGQVVIEILALLTVEATRIVFAGAGAMDLGGRPGTRSALSSRARSCLPPAPPPASGAPHHALRVGLCPWGGRTLRGVSVAEAVATHNQLVEGVVVLLPDLAPRIQQVVAQRVQPCQVHPQVGDLQQV